jgi:hypothetical protein
MAPLRVFVFVAFHLYVAFITTGVLADPCSRIHGMVNNMHMSIALGSFDIDAVTAVTLPPFVLPPYGILSTTAVVSVKLCPSDDPAASLLSVTLTGTGFAENATRTSHVTVSYRFAADVQPTMDWTAGAASWVLTTAETVPEYAALSRVGRLTAVCAHGPLQVTVSNTSGQGEIAMSGAAFCAERVTHSSSISASLTSSRTRSRSGSQTASASHSSSASASGSGTITSGGTMPIQPQVGPDVALTSIGANAPVRGMAPTFIHGDTIRILGAPECDGAASVCAVLRCNTTSDTAELLWIDSTGFASNGSDLSASTTITCTSNPVLLAVMSTLQPANSTTPTTQVVVTGNSGTPWVAVWQRVGTTPNLRTIVSPRTLPCELNETLRSSHALPQFAAVMVACQSIPTIVAFDTASETITQFSYDHALVASAAQLAIARSPEATPMWLTIGHATEEKGLIHIANGGTTVVVDANHGQSADPVGLAPSPLLSANSEECYVWLAYSVGTSLRGACALYRDPNVSIASPVWIVPHAVALPGATMVYSHGVFGLCVLSVTPAALFIVDVATGASAFRAGLYLDLRGTAPVKPHSLAYHTWLDGTSNSTVLLAREDGSLFEVELDAVYTPAFIGLATPRIRNVASAPCVAAATAITVDQLDVAKWSILCSNVNSPNATGGYLVVNPRSRWSSSHRPPLTARASLIRPVTVLNSPSSASSVPVAVGAWSCSVNATTIVVTYGVPHISIGILPPEAVPLTLSGRVGPGPISALAFLTFGNGDCFYILTRSPSAVDSDEWVITLSAAPAGTTAAGITAVYCHSTSAVATTTSIAAFVCVRRVGDLQLGTGIIMAFDDDSQTLTTISVPLFNVSVVSEPVAAWVISEGPIVFVAQNAVLLFDAAGNPLLKHAVGLTIELSALENTLSFVGIFATPNGSTGQSLVVLVTPLVFRILTTPVPVAVAAFTSFGWDSLVQCVMIPRTAAVSDPAAEVVGWFVSFDPQTLAMPSLQPWAGGIPAQALYGASSVIDIGATTLANGWFAYSTGPFDVRVLGPFGSRLSDDPSRPLQAMDLRTVLPAGVNASSTPCRQRFVPFHTLPNWLIVVAPTCHLVLLRTSPLTLHRVVDRLVRPGSERNVRRAETTLLVLIVPTMERTHAGVLLPSGNIGFEIPTSVTAVVGVSATGLHIASSTVLVNATAMLPTMQVHYSIAVDSSSWLWSNDAAALLADTEKKFDTRGIALLWIFGGLNVLPPTWQLVVFDEASQRTVPTDVSTWEAVAVLPPTADGRFDVDFSDVPYMRTARGNVQWTALQLYSSFGFIDSLDISGMANVFGELPLPSLLFRRLNVSGTSVHGNASMAGLSSALAVLNISHTRMACDAGCFNASSWAGLVSLAAAGVPMRGDLAMGSLNYTSPLRHLDLSGSGLGAALPALTMPPTFPALEVLALPSCAIQGALWADLDALPALRMLDLRDNALTLAMVPGAVAARLALHCNR